MAEQLDRPINWTAVERNWEALRIHSMEFLKTPFNNAPPLPAMAEENSNKRIARNTILLYTRSLINLVIGLYTSRLTLDALGIPDYGIYNVVGSLVALFGLFNGSLNTAISRFITYELGRNNNQRLNKVFPPP